MYYLRILMTVLALAGMALPAWAEPICTPTARIRTAHYPGAANIPPTNNLQLPTGKSVEPEGQRLIINGRVVDNFCRPIPEAVVELWQMDPYGKWGVAKRTQLATPYPEFSGAGRTTTDGEGYFVFTTAFPGSIETAGGKKTRASAIAPQLHVRVNPPYKMPDFSTVLFFNGERRNDTDSTYKRLKPEQRESVLIQLQPDMYGDLSGSILLVLPGQARYRTY